MSTKTVLELSSKYDSPNFIHAKAWKELPTDTKNPELILFGYPKIGFQSEYIIKDIKVVAEISYLPGKKTTNESNNFVLDAIINGTTLFFCFAPLGKQKNAVVLYGEVRVQSFNLSGNNVDIAFVGTSPPKRDKFK